MTTIMHRVLLGLALLVLCGLNDMGVKAVDPPSQPMKEYIIGGLFPISAFSSGEQRFFAARLAVDIINNLPLDSSLLPNRNFRLRFIATDSAADASLGSKLAYTLLSGTHGGGSGLISTSPFTPARRSSLMDASCQAESIAERALALIGEASSDVSVAVASVASMLNKVQISYSSTSTELSDRKKYDTFFRVVPSDLAQAQLLVSIVRFFDWKQVAVIASLGTYGLGLASGFISAATNFNIKTTLRTFQPLDHLAPPQGTNGAAIREALKNVRDSGFRIIVGCFVERDAVHVLLEAYNLGMAGPDSGFVFLSTDAWSADSLFTSLANDVTPAQLLTLQRAATGVVGTRPYSIASEFKAVVAPYAASLAQRFNRSASIFDSINTFTPYTYDAVWALAIAINNLTSIGRSPTDTTALLAALRSVNFKGTSGQVRFTSNFDRLPQYHIANSQINSDGKLSFLTIGEWDESKSSAIVLNTPAKFSDGSSKVPPDSVRPTGRLSSDLAWFALTIVTLLSILSSLNHGYIWAYRRRKQLAAMAPNLLNLIVSGTWFGYAGILVVAFGEGAFQKCHLTSLFFFVSFSLTLGTMMAKTFRLYDVFENRQLHRRNVAPEWKVFLFIATLVSWDVIVCLVYWIYWPAVISRSTDLTDSSYDVEICSYSNIWFLIVFIGFVKAAIVISGGVVAVIMRNVPDNYQGINFNESHTIAVCIWLELFLVLIAGLMWYFLRGNLLLAHIALVVGVFMYTVTLLSVLIIPRLYAAWKDPTEIDSRRHECDTSDQQQERDAPNHSPARPRPRHTSRRQLRVSFTPSSSSRLVIPHSRASTVETEHDAEPEERSAAASSESLEITVIPPSAPACDIPPVSSLSHDSASRSHESSVSDDSVHVETSKVPEKETSIGPAAV